MFFWRRRSQNTPATPADEPETVPTLSEKPQSGEPVPDSSTAPTAVSHPIPPREVMAVLEVTEGPDALLNGEPVGKRIEIRTKRVTLGRNPRQANIQLYSLDVPSSVSRLHCTIEFHDALRCFFITDEGSSSGTKVDERALTPYKQHSLRNGDVIELGVLSKQGALLRFSSIYSPPERLSVEGGVNVKETIRHTLQSPLRASIKPVHRDVFLSYSRRDRDKMRVIHDGLVANNLTVWSDEALEPGSPSWRRDVQTAIEGASCVVAILSPDAKESEWVNEELGYARIHKSRIFTALVRGDESNSVPLGLTGIQWIDMRSDYAADIEEIVHKAGIEQLVKAVNDYLNKGVNTSE